nr:(Fe-S)-binding protein [Geothrix sp. SG198]
MVTATTKADPGPFAAARAKVLGCDRCGTCLPVCPLFQVQDVERASARGKNALVRGLAEGLIPPDREAQEALEFCLLCRACTDACPGKVPTDEAMLQVRQALADTLGSTSLRSRWIGRVLRRRRLVGLGAATLAGLRAVGLHRLLPSQLVPRETSRQAYLEKHAGPALLGAPAPRPEPALHPGAKVAYFQGCGMKLLFPDASRSTQRILAQLSPVQRPDHPCCGLPHLAHGQREAFLGLAQENIRAFEGADLVVTDCASCSGTLKHLASWFAGDPVWADRAARFSAKVMDLTEYLAAAGYRPQALPGATFTYHDPCHLARGQGIRRQPRQLLEQAGKLIELKEKERCCGGSGSFHLEHPRAAEAILRRKQEDIQGTGAQVVVTACPGCLIQLTRAAEQSGGAFQAMHISQVI